MQVDFYQLTRDPAHVVLPAIAQKILDEGRRLLIVSADMGQLKSISASLWGWKAESFLAHERADKGGSAEQPILLSQIPRRRTARGWWRSPMANGAMRRWILIASSIFLRRKTPIRRATPGARLRIGRA